MITILVDKSIYRRLSKYVRYICAPTDPKHWVLYSVAIDKWNHIINGIIDSLGNATNGGCICPYPKFSNNGKYRMIQIRDLKTRTTVWDISFEDVLDNSGNIVKRIVYGIELDKVLASIDESIRCITQSDICRIVESTVREYLNRQVLNENKNTCLSFVDTDGCKWDAVSSFQNGRGVGYIVEDDGCYLIYVKGKGGYWRSEYIFPEAYSALQLLPSPDTLD